MKLMLRQKVTGLAVIAALLPVVVLLALLSAKKAEIRTTVNAELQALVRDNTAQVTKDVVHLCRTANALIQEAVNSSLNVARLVLTQQGEVTETEDVVSWRAINQYTKLPTPQELPKFTVGGEWLGQNADLDVRTPVIDEVAALVGGTCTIFQRMNEAGDMLRVATNVETLESTRAIGTYIPAVNADGTANLVISTVMKGETYRGAAYVVNAWYLTAYEPILDKSGRIMGVLYVGVKRDEVVSVIDGIKDIRVGKTGYVWVVGTAGEQEGRYIVSKKGSGRDGEDILNTPDPVTGRFFIKDITAKARTLRPGEVALDEYYWKNPSDPEARLKVTAFAHFEPWQWVVAAGTYLDDYESTRVEVESVLGHLLWQAIACGAIILAAMVALALAIGAKITDPIGRITAVAEVIAQGDLLNAKQSLETFDGGTPAETPDSEQPKDETGQLLSAIRTMTQNLNSLVGQVQRSGIQATTSATEIAASARQLEGTTSEQAASANQAASTAKEITATAQDLTRTMGEVASVATETGNLANEGQQNLAEMESGMSQLAEATSSISSKLSVINEKAANISAVVTTISKVADQTNLLSLNAAIEAEKAGEYGQGFSVVAREIRRLADQTAVATLDIEDMVKEMQSAVSVGVMEMDKFNQEVRRSVEEVRRISDQQGHISEQVQALSPRFESVNEGMRVQSDGAHQISDSMMQLSEAAQQIAESIREFNKATEQLNEASRALQNEVSKFKVSA